MDIFLVRPRNAVCRREILPNQQSTAARTAQPLPPAGSTTTHERNSVTTSLTADRSSRTASAGKLRSSS